MRSCRLKGRSCCNGRSCYNVLLLLLEQSFSFWMLCVRCSFPFIPAVFQDIGSLAAACLLCKWKYSGWRTERLDVHQTLNLLTNANTLILRHDQQSIGALPGRGRQGSSHWHPRGVLFAGGLKHPLASTRFCCPPFNDCGIAASHQCDNCWLLLFRKLTALTTSAVSVRCCGSVRCSAVFLCDALFRTMLFLYDALFRTMLCFCTMLFSVQCCCCTMLFSVRCCCCTLLFSVQCCFCTMLEYCLQRALVPQCAPVSPEQSRYLSFSFAVPSPKGSRSDRAPVFIRTVEISFFFFFPCYAFSMQCFFFTMLECVYHLQRALVPIALLFSSEQSRFLLQMALLPRRVPVLQDSLPC
jgi:hypothetical protein